MSSTTKQQKAVEGIVESRRNGLNKTKGEVLLEAGYSVATAIKPSQVTESKGFKEELAKYGLDEGLITKCLVSDIKNKPKKRFFELNLGAEILGMKKRSDPHGENKILIVNITNHGATKYRINSSPSPNTER